jgi:hypothetical protein
MLNFDIDVWLDYELYGTGLISDMIKEADEEIRSGKSHMDQFILIMKLHDKDEHIQRLHSWQQTDIKRHNQKQLEEGTQKWNTAKAKKELILCSL